MKSLHTPFFGRVRYVRLEERSSRSQTAAVTKSELRVLFSDVFEDAGQERELLRERPSDRRPPAHKAA